MLSVLRQMPPDLLKMPFSTIPIITCPLPCVAYAAGSWQMMCRFLKCALRLGLYVVAGVIGGRGVAGALG